jgi:hypothetical protein
MTEKIALHSVPRSGSSWLGEILNSSEKVKYCFQPLFSYALKDYLNLSATASNVEVFFGRLQSTEDSFINQTEQRRNGFLPSFRKASSITHICYKEVRYHNLLQHLCRLDCGLKFILLVRNPIEVMNSWIAAPREFDQGWSVAEELFLAPSKNLGKCEEFYGLKRWAEAAKDFESLRASFPERVLLVKYADLTSDLLNTVRLIFDFCRLELGKQTQQFLEESRTKCVEGVYSVFRGGAKTVKLSLIASQVEFIRGFVEEEGLADYLQ